MKFRTTLLSAVICAASLSVLPVSAGEGAAEGRVEYAQHMIFESSAAKQVMSAQDTKALVAYEKAKSLFEQAKQETDKAKCDALINEALSAMFEAVRLSKPQETIESKLKRDVENKKKSVDALLESLQYISLEKDSSAKLKEIEKEVADLIAQADESLESDPQQSLALVNQSIELLKTQIQVLREGETLVRSLDFATPEEEYLYELDRNEAHRLLVDVLLKEKVESSERIKNKVDGYMNEALILKAQALAAAESGDFESAIGLLEESTKAIVKAIRGAGVYIPG